MRNGDWDGLNYHTISLEVIHSSRPTHSVVAFTSDGVRTMCVLLVQETQVLHALHHDETVPIQISVNQDRVKCRHMFN